MTKALTDGRILLLERLLANVRLTRESKKTDAKTSAFAEKMEVQYAKQIEDLRAEIKLEAQGTPRPEVQEVLT